MPSNFSSRAPQRKRKTLADLLREIQDGPRASKPAFTTAPIAGPGRIRKRQKQNNQETELDRRRRLAEDALRQLKDR